MGDKAHLIRDSFALFRSDHLPCSVPLNLIAGIRNEEHYLPWASLRKSYISKYLFKKDPETYEILLVSDLLVKYPKNHFPQSQNSLVVFILYF